MRPPHRRGFSLGGIAGILLACLALPVLSAPPASVVLLDFKEESQLAQLHASDQTKIEPAAEDHQGNPAARIEFAPPPEGLSDFPEVAIEGNLLKVRDFTPYGAISLWVKNAGPDAADLSLEVWDKDGKHAVPSTARIKPGGWEQIVARLALDGLDAAQIGSVHLYQKAKRQPVALLIADVELLSPSAAQLADRIRAARAAINTARANAAALGAQDQIEPQIAALAHGLDQLESSAMAGAADGLTELTRISTEAGDLAKAIQIGNGGKEVVLTGPLVQAAWLSDPEKVKLFVRFTLSNSSVGDEIFPFLAPAKDLEVMFLDSKKITGAGLDKLTSEKLRRLVLSSTGATDEGLKDIGKLIGMQRLELDGTKVTSGVLAHLEGLKKLRILSLAGTQVSDKGFAAIGKLTSLESLDLKGTRIRAEGVRCLEGLPKLKSLDLGDTQVDDDDLSQFGKLTQLESLSLENTPITGAGFAKLPGLSRFTELKLSKTHVSDTVLRYFGKLPRLTRLELSSTRVSDGGLSEILESASHLQYLDLFGTSITDASLAFLQNKLEMDSLFLGGTQITDAGAANFAKLTNLEHVDLEGTQITDASLQYLQGQKLFDLRLGKTRISGPGLKYLANTRGMLFLDLSETNVTDDSLAAMARLDHLQTLQLSGSRVTSQGMRQLQGCGSLSELSLEATEVGDEGLALLAPLQNLQRLNLNESAVTDAGLKHLIRLRRLTNLGLSGDRITDDGLLELGSKYVELNLSHTQITNRGVAHLQGRGPISKLSLASTAITNDALKLLQVLPGLTSLDLSETAIDDSGLQYLTRLPQLQELNLNGTLVSDRGVDVILKMPRLERLSLEGSQVSAPWASYLEPVPKSERGILRGGL